METDDLSVQTPDPEAPRPQADLIESRFLFVDVAALRAKQLRRGALPRLGEVTRPAHRPVPHKPERVAMEEVQHRLVLWDVPPTPET